VTNNSADEFFTWVGKCITSWAQVEEHLFEICVTTLGAERHRVAIIYYRTPTLDARISLTDELARTVLPRRDPPDGGHGHPDTIMWGDVRRPIVGLLPVRNRLAHHPVTHKELGPALSLQGWAMPIISSWYESYVSEAEQLRGKHENIRPLTAPDLSRHRAEVEALIQHLNLFRARVLPKYAVKGREPH
jgi:hypothetical protein